MVRFPARLGGGCPYVHMQRFRGHGTNDCGPSGHEPILGLGLPRALGPCYALSCAHPRTCSSCVRPIGLPRNMFYDMSPQSWNKYLEANDKRFWTIYDVMSTWHSSHCKIASRITSSEVHDQQRVFHRRRLRWSDTAISRDRPMSR